MNKWTLYTGGITSQYIETIGDGIDLDIINFFFKNENLFVLLRKNSN